MIQKGNSECMMYLRIIRAFSKSLCIIRVICGTGVDAWSRGRRLNINLCSSGEEQSGREGGHNFSSIYCVPGAFACNFSWDFHGSLRYVSLFSIYR